VQQLDRDRLKSLLGSAAEVLSLMTSQAIESKLRPLPPMLSVALRPMADPRQIRSTISDALTAIDELDDDECLALLNLANREIEALMPRQGEDDVIRAMRKGSLLAARREAARAIEHLKQLVAQ